MAKRRAPIAALDIETTPGEYGETPIPILVCIVSDDLHFSVSFWGEDCIHQAAQFLSAQKVKGRLLAHNGGKFDYGYFVHDTGNKRVIGSRLLTSEIGGWKTLDTMLLMPTALKNLGDKSAEKGEMRLEYHRLDATESEREYLIKYCFLDCRVLLDAYRRFCKVFTGDPDTPCKDTAAANAFKALKAHYPDAPASAWKTTKLFDTKYRPFYHGGIVNTFGPARDISGSFTMVDANSMYPAAMKNYQHPCSNRIIDVVNPRLTKDGKLDKFGDRVFFIEFEGFSTILPHVSKTGALEYNVTGVYHVTSHELQAAIRHGFVRVDRVISAHICRDTQDYSDFVDEYYGLRMAEKAKGNAEEYVYKIVLNSAYGKFGQDPENYSEIVFCEMGVTPDNTEGYSEWKPKGKTEDGVNVIWERSKLLEDDDGAFINVATAASITGAARACLIDAIGAVIHSGGIVHYCDTDSLVFEGAPTMTLGSKLGEWKIELELDRVVIAGPKLYAFKKAGKDAWKVASKGVRVSADAIVKLVADIEDIVYRPDMGSFDVAGVYRTIKRTIKRSSLKR